MSSRYLPLLEYLSLDIRSCLLYMSSVHSPRPRPGRRRLAETQIKDGEMTNAVGAPTQGQENPPATTLEVFIAYNGVEREFTVAEHETVRALLNDAIRTFGVSNTPHLL